MTCEPAISFFGPQVLHHSQPRRSILTLNVLLSTEKSSSPMEKFPDSLKKKNSTLKTAFPCVGDPGASRGAVSLMDSAETSYSSSVSSGPKVKSWLARVWTWPLSVMRAPLASTSRESRLKVNFVELAEVQVILPDWPRIWAEMLSPLSKLLPTTAKASPRDKTATAAMAANLFCTP
eukprot:01700_3